MAHIICLIYTTSPEMLGEHAVCVLRSDLSSVRTWGPATCRLAIVDQLVVITGRQQLQCCLDEYLTRFSVAPRAVTEEHPDGKIVGSHHAVGELPDSALYGGAVFFQILLKVGLGPHPYRRRARFTHA